MKKIISALAALSIICGSFCTAVPAAAADTTAAATESTGAAEFDLEKSHTSSEADGIKYDVYSDFAVVTKVTDEDIEEFTVPETYKDKPVVGLTDDPFAKCKKLKKINLSKNTAIFEWNGIAIEGIEEVTVPEDSKYFTSVDGVIYSKDKKSLVCCPTACGKTEITLADETESIMPCAFACCRDLKKLTMNDKLENIYYSAFWGCSGLTEVKFSKNLKRIGYFGFAGCSSLKEVDLPDSLEEVYDDVFKDAACVKTIDQIQYVDDWAVGSDKEIVSGDIRKGTVGTANGIFSNRYYLRRIYVPGSVKHITKYLLVGLGKNLDIDFVEFHNDTIPAACLATTGIKSIYICDPNCKIEDAANALPAYWVQHDDSYYPKDEDDKPTEYTLERNQVTTSSSGSHNKSVVVNTELVELDEKISYEASAEDIAKGEDYTQKYAELNEKIQKQLEERKEKQEQKDTSGFAVAQPVEGKVYSAPIKIGAAPKYDTVIHGVSGSTAEDYAVKYRRVFKPLEMRTDLDPQITDGGNVSYKKYLDTYATALVRINNGNKIDEITIAPEIDGAPVKEISVPRANADTIHIPATVLRYVQQENSGEDQVAYYDVDKDNPYLTSVDGILYSKDMTKLIKVPSRYAGKKLVVPDGVKVIDSFACYGLENVESVELPDSVEIIGRCSFLGCKKLSSIKLSEKLDVIGQSAFLSCTSLKDIKLPESVNHIGFAAFNNMPAVKYENGLGYLGDWLVETGDAHYVSSITPKEGTVGIAQINVYAPLVVPKSITKMSWEMVDNHSTVQRADVYSHIIDYDAFKNTRYLKDIYIYDPECEISAGILTIGSKYLKVNGNASPMPSPNFAMTRTLAEDLKPGEDEELDDVVIHGYKNSTAEAYAKMYDIKFEAIDDSKAHKGGDLNGDGNLNVADLVMVSRYIHGLTSLNEKQTKSADLNGDGNVDIFDMVEFRKKILESMRDN